MPDPFIWDEQNHIARTPAGVFIPSSTQILEAQHLSFNFRKYVEPDLLDRRSKIGTEVHDLTDIYDKFGEIDPGWLNIDTAGFVESYIGLRRLSGFVPQEWSVRMCETINGVQWTGELDKFGLLNGRTAIIDLKTGTGKSDGWGFQLSSYEMLKYRSAKIGRVIRAVAHLKSDGSPGRLIEFGEFSKVDGISYADTFMAAAFTTQAAIRRGYLGERDFTEAA